ncbi:hypothetical protein OAT16_05180 [Prolixibacteraceae bacterium]|nr:hypothetical protein [Prolixibacteraceae bacterium]
MKMYTQSMDEPIKPYKAFVLATISCCIATMKEIPNCIIFKQDIGEKHNIIAFNTKKAKELCDKLVAQIKQVKAQTPLDIKIEKTCCLSTLIALVDI